MDSEPPAMFRFIHHGRSAQPPTGTDGIIGSADFADWDEAACCPACGAGGVQLSRGRIVAASLTRCPAFTTTGLEVDADLIVSDTLRRAISQTSGIDLPVREIEQVGRGRKKERWWQVFPTTGLRLDDVRILKGNLRRCDACQAPWPVWGSGPIVIEIRRDTTGGRIPEPVVWAPPWHGEISRAADGRLLSLPVRSILLRPDLVAALRQLRVRNLELIPVAWC